MLPALKERVAPLMARRAWFLSFTGNEWPGPANWLDDMDLRFAAVSFATGLSFRLSHGLGGGLNLGLT